MHVTFFFPSQRSFDRPHVHFSRSGRFPVVLWTPLHRATLWNHIPIITQLHNKNANLNAIDENNWTPLHIAVKWNRLQAVELLIAFGANVTIKVCFFFYNVPFEFAMSESSSCLEAPAASR
jgi:ankyrin repeat protein